ncbi:hypothetical protein G4G28_17645 [Massilia sp. Dwa41.01b]|uniref:hypothetical protein n=1 Tax=unclassified Massilia TaxID=2609279 RepID=UPI0016012F66|nr:MULTISPECIES: hypothetical protein [unclassified Massilia]QNA89858.1 hypothetical protein G4G28_17645 [Massilia sp. Dwa41.01b]QNB00748.1 hypothetical protein G4G31_21205 [Massilia sp. Se16.2.3]
MDANQRSEMNNQTNNGANEKWNKNAKGKTAPDAPLDHTYPQGASQQQGHQGVDQMGTQQSGMGPDAAGRGEHWEIPGGSMQSQQNGGSGPVQGITDSHQRQMEQHSSAYGQLEQPVGRRPAGTGTSLLDLQGERAGHTDATNRMNPQDARQPELQGGSLGHHHGVGMSMQSDTSGQSQQRGGYSSGTGSAGMTGGPGAAGATSSTDRGGSQTGAGGRETGTTGRQPHDPGTSLQQEPNAVRESNEGRGMPASPGNNDPQNANGGWRDASAARADEDIVHESNDMAGGLPRSPGNTGSRGDDPGWRAGAGAQQDQPGVHDSNDAAGGYPKSPAGANRLAGDRKMDDDTGFSRG